MSTISISDSVASRTFDARTRTGKNEDDLLVPLGTEGTTSRTLLPQAARVPACKPCSSAYATEVLPLCRQRRTSSIHSDFVRRFLVTLC